MPVVTVYPGGSSAGFAGPGRRKGDAGKTRGAIVGWSRGSARRLVSWLWSVDASKLERGGWAVTLTVGTTPDHARQWAYARKKLVERLRYAGVTQVQWLTEWTAKGRPHMHMAVFRSDYDEHGTERTWGERDLERLIVPAWLEVCDTFGWEVSTMGQDVKPMTAEQGWLEYLSKHAARGVMHYQRQGAPDGWETTGRLWGVSGDWPIVEPVKVELDRAQFARYRRLVLRYQRSRMTALGRAPRAGWERSRIGERDKGAYMGVSGWIPDTVSAMFIELALEVRDEPRWQPWE